MPGLRQAGTGDEGTGSLSRSCLMPDGRPRRGQPLYNAQSMDRLLKSPVMAGKNNVFTECYQGVM